MAIVAQDWEYPRHVALSQLVSSNIHRFKTKTDVKLPGMGGGALKCSCIGKYPVVITGKVCQLGFSRLLTDVSGSITVS